MVLQGNGTDKNLGQTYVVPHDSVLVPTIWALSVF